MWGILSSVSLQWLKDTWVKAEEKKEEEEVGEEEKEEVGEEEKEEVGEEEEGEQRA